MKSSFLSSTKLKHFFLISISLFLTVSCSSDDTVEVLEEVVVLPIELACDYFLENRTLADNPDAPIDYIVSCNAQVRGDLVIEPGVVIAFTQDSGLIFYETTSSLRAIGTAAKPIVLTGTNQTRGYWRGIIFYSGDPANTMDHVNISYGGGQSFNSNNDRGNIIVYADGALNMNNCISSFSETAGFNAVYGSSNISIENSSFVDNAYPLLVNYIYTGKTSNTNNYIGNDLDRVLLYVYTAVFLENTTWRKINVPYLTSGGNGVNHLVTNANLTIEPGTIIEMSTDMELRVADEAGLKAVGTVSSPIIFRGENPVAGGWRGITFSGTNAINEIAFAEISHATQDPTNTKGSVYLWYEAKLNIHDVQFNDVLGCAVYGKIFASQTSNPNYSSYNLSYNNVSCQEFFEY